MLSLHRRSVWFAVAAWLLMALLLYACTPETPAAPTATPTAYLAPGGEAEIDSLEVLRSTTAEDIFQVAVRGTFADECVRLTDARLQRSGASFAVELTTQQLVNVTCSGIRDDFERVIPLDGSSLEAGVYTITAGAHSATFEVVRHATPTPMESSPGDPQPTAEPTAEPTPTPTVDPGQAAQPECIDKAAFYDDITIPDGTVLQPGEAFVKTWRLRNEGDCTWGDGYRLVFDNGDQMGGPATVEIPTAAPRDIIDISVPMTAPDAGGAYTGNWLLQNPARVRFGTGNLGQFPIWVKLTVNAPREVLPPGSTVNCPATPNPGYLQQVLALINDARAAQSLNTLTLDSRLAAAADAHSLDMACNDFVEHYGYDGSDWYDRIAAQGYNYGAASENIYAGNPNFSGNAEGAFKWWMNSQIHRDAILSPKFTQVGIGYAYYSGSTYKGYFTVVFARPK
jgi:uncharacterized protein YkwD